MNYNPMKSIIYEVNCRRRAASLVRRGTEPKQVAHMIPHSVMKELKEGTASSNLIGHVLYFLRVVVRNGMKLLLPEIVVRSLKRDLLSRSHLHELSSVYARK